MGDESGSPSPEIRTLRERVETLERQQNRLLQAVIEMHQRNERLRERLDTETEQRLVDSSEYPTLAAILSEELGSGTVESPLGISGTDQDGTEREEPAADTESESQEDQRRI